MLKTGLKNAGTLFRRLRSRWEPLFYSLPAGLRAPAGRPGQNTIEFLLMLGVVAGMAAMMGVLFHKKILGGLFTLVGMIIGAGTPK